MCFSKISIYAKDEKVYALTPYSGSFIENARKIGGKWDETNKVWAFDERDTERVRELCVDVFGTDGLAFGDELVNVRIYLDKGLFQEKSNSSLITLFGRTIIERKYRDYAVKFSDGVILISGGFPESGGSSKNPLLSPKNDTVLEIRDVPRGIAEKRRKIYGDDAIEILANDKKVNTQALKEEAVAIRKRLAEILEILAGEGERV